MSGNGMGQNGDDGELAARLKRLDDQLLKHEPKTKPGSGPRGDVPGTGVSPLGQAMRLSSEFMAGIIVGGGIGWTIDYFAGTKPWGLMVFLVLGFASGIYNVMRTSGFIAKPSRKNGQDAN